MTGVINHLLGMLMLRPITGPIAGKELRVASRMKRYYLMRLAYIVSLLAIVCVGWFTESRRYYGMSVSVYLSETVMRICLYVMMFQFYAGQVVAILLLSNAISEEADKRSLGVLLTTPIHSFQIAGGKLTSRFIFIFQLLCLSLPILAVIRVLGGIDWDFIINMFLLTVVSVFFVSAITVCVATFFQKSYATLIVSSLIVLGYYWSYHYWPIRRVMYDLFNIIPFMGWLVPSLNPYQIFEVLRFEASSGYLYAGARGLTIYLGGLEDASRVPAILLAPWFYYVQLILIAGMSLCVLLLAGRRIRRVAIKQMSRVRKAGKRRLLGICEAVIRKLPRIGLKKEIRSVRGEALVWKEMHNSLFRGELLRGRGIYFILIGANLIVFLLLSLFVLFDADAVFRISIFGSVIGSLLMTAITSASTISQEKQTSSWQILLCTPLSDGDIIKGKVAGVMRRAGVCWAALVLLIGILSYAQLCHYSSLLFAVIIGIEFFAFLAGIGIYFSVISKKTTNAILAVLVIGGLLWIVPPVIVEVVWHGYYGGWFGDLMMEINPLVQVIKVIEGAYIDGHFLTCPNCTFWEIYGFSTLSVMGYMSGGWFFLWRAKRRLRKSI